MTLATPRRPFVADARVSQSLRLMLAITIVALIAGCGRSDSSAPPAAGGSTAQDNDGTKTPPSEAPSDIVNGGKPPGGSSAPAAAETKLPDATAREIVDRMIHAYRNATSYADAAEVRIKIDRPGQNDLKPLSHSISFTRPNKLRVECFDSMLVCDGKQLHGSTGEVPQQVLELEAPAQLHVGDLFAGPALHRSLTECPGGFPIQLLLLLPDAPLPPQLENDPSTRIVGSDSFDGAECWRIQIDTSDGPWVLWIDKQAPVVRRNTPPLDVESGFWFDKELPVLRLMELPTGGLRRQLEAEGPVKDLAVTVELLGARLNQPVPDVAFEFDVPKDAKLVKQLLGPPPAPPSELLGHDMPDFEFTGIDGGPVSRKSLSGKVAVIDFWFTNSGPYRQTFPQLNQVFQKYKSTGRVEFVAVNIDPPEASDALVSKTVRSWGAEFPLARDTTGEAVEKLHILPEAPTLLVLGPDGTLQDYEVGLNPHLATELPATIDALLAGRSIAASVKQQAEDRVAEYERRIQTRDENKVEALPDAKIAPRDEPRSVKLTRRWVNKELKNPGNLLVVEDPRDRKAPPRLMAADGAHTVVELDGQGKIVARHELAIPPEAVVNILRTAVDGKGQRYYAGSASGQQQLFLFDTNWKLLMAFPDLSLGKHAGIGDVQFIDFDGQGDVKLAVGYWGLVGVQIVSLEGKRLASDRSMQFVLRLAVGPRDEKGERHLLCTNSRGSIVPIDTQGQPSPEWLLPGLMLETIGSIELVPGEPTAVASLASNLQREPLVVGLGARGQDMWHYPLPSGIYRTPVEPLTSASLVTPLRHWLIAAADGSVHFVAADGAPLDSFHYGAALTGLAGVRVGDEPFLIVATPGSVEAWQVEAK